MHREARPYFLLHLFVILLLFLKLIKMKGGGFSLDLPLVSSLATADGVFYFKSLS
jgi:hypothetical protein